MFLKILRQDLKKPPQKASIFYYHQTASVFQGLNNSKFLLELVFVFEKITDFSWNL